MASQNRRRGLSVLQGNFPRVLTRPVDETAAGDAFIGYLLAGLLASLACGVMGSYVVVKRIVFISGGISHTAYGGVGLGYLLGISPLIGAAGVSAGLDPGAATGRAPAYFPPYSFVGLRYIPCRCCSGSPPAAAGCC